jgi:hypothetical protein
MLRAEALRRLHQHLHGSQRIADLVGDSSGQLSDRGQLVGVNDFAMSRMKLLDDRRYLPGHSGERRGIPIIKHTALPRRLVTGVHRFDKTWLVIGRGLGFATWQIRMFCPAEVIELQLRRKE